MNRPEINSFAVLESASFSAVSRGASPDTADSRVTNLLWSSGTNRGFIEGGPSGSWDCIDPVVLEAPTRRGIVRDRRGLLASVGRRRPPPSIRPPVWVAIESQPPDWRSAGNCQDRTFIK